jgi:hypothetical protein
VIRNEDLSSETQYAKAAPSSGRGVETPVSASTSCSTKQSTEPTETYRSWDIPVLGSLNRECSVTAALCQFFNISSASSNDIDYLLFARRYGKTYASVITSKPAICDHLKTGQRSRAQDM